MPTTFADLKREAENKAAEAKGKKADDAVEAAKRINPGGMGEAGKRNQARKEARRRALEAESVPGFVGPPRPPDLKSGAVVRKSGRGGGRKMTGGRC
jgi:hypothetical protein